ncbi:hypothetical protein [Streptomyces sp. EWL5.16]|uniref:hypothetical protein n=1 Tax=Streptomyces sp. EWL5.16 TaxID=3461011 RepID=UPI00404326A1
MEVERDDEGIPFGIRHSGGYYVAVDTQGPRITALRLLDEPPSRYRPGAAPDEGTVVMRYGYDAAGNLTEVINSSGEPLRFTYDAEGRVTRWTDRNGTWFGYVYDARGRVVRTEGVDGILSGSLTYDDTARTTTYTDSQGHVSVHRYNAEGRVVEETDPLGHVTRTGMRRVRGPTPRGDGPAGPHHAVHVRRRRRSHRPRSPRRHCGPGGVQSTRPPHRGGRARRGGLAAHVRRAGQPADDG